MRLLEVEAPRGRHAVAETGRETAHRAVETERSEGRQPQPTTRTQREDAAHGMLPRSPKKSRSGKIIIIVAQRKLAAAAEGADEVRVPDDVETIAVAASPHLAERERRAEV